MKNNKTLLITIALFIPFIFISCDKDSNFPALAPEVEGNYKGTITSSEDPSNAFDAEAEVVPEGDNSVMVSIHSQMLDTSFMMNLYEDDDSIMVCYTGEIFYHEYGHHLDEGHHMMGDDHHWPNWSHHMDEQHQPGDHHYGGFDMNDHSFSYRIISQEQQLSYYFQGSIE